MQDPNSLDPQIKQRLQEALSDPLPMSTEAKRELFARIAEENQVSPWTRERLQSLRQRLWSPRGLLLAMSLTLIGYGTFRWTPSPLPQPAEEHVVPSGEEGFVVSLWSEVLIDENVESGLE